MSIVYYFHHILQVLAKSELPVLESWQDSRLQLCPLVVRSEGLIEESGSGTLQVSCPAPKGFFFFWGGGIVVIFKFVCFVLFACLFDMFICLGLFVCL